MTIDLTPVVQALLALALPVLTAIAGTVAAFLVKRFRLQNNALMAGQIAEASKRAAGLAYHFLLANAGTISHVAIHNVAIAQGVNYVTAGFPEALAAVGVTPDHVANMVTGELGKLLALDPTVSVAGAVNAAAQVAPVPAGAAAT